MSWGLNSLYILQEVKKRTKIFSRVFIYGFFFPHSLPPYIIYICYICFATYKEKKRSFSIFISPKEKKSKRFNGDKIYVLDVNEDRHMSFLCAGCIFIKLGNGCALVLCHFLFICAGTEPVMFTHSCDKEKKYPKT